jgi:hypothetical protein
MIFRHSIHSYLGSAILGFAILMLTNSFADAIQSTWMHPNGRCKMQGCDNTYRSTMDTPGYRCFGGSCPTQLTCTYIKNNCIDKRTFYAPDRVGKCDTKFVHCMRTGVWLYPKGKTRSGILRE